MSETINLSSLIAWLAEKPAAEKYVYGDTCGCLFYQFLTAKKVDVADVVPYGWYDNAGKYYGLPDAFEDISLNRPHTFGSALRRARFFAKARGE